MISVGSEKGKQISRPRAESNKTAQKKMKSIIGQRKVVREREEAKKK